MNAAGRDNSILEGAVLLRYPRVELCSQWSKSPKSFAGEEHRTQTFGGLVLVYRKLRTTPCPAGTAGSDAVR